MEEKSLIEVAIEWMQNQNKQDKHYTIKDIAKKVFEKKGLKISENKEEYAQFQMDFMLSGYFISYGEDKEGNKLWELKYRLKHDVIDKESNDYYDVDEDNDEVKKNELSINDAEYDENDNYQEEATFDKDNDEEDEEDEKEEMDDIEQELILRESVEAEDVEEDSYDDEDE